MTDMGYEPLYPELNRLICAAVSNQQLAAMLLQTPEVALNAWERRHPLSSNERALVVSTIAGGQQITDIHDFAAMLYTRSMAATQSS